MPIEVGIWKLGKNLQRVKTVSMNSESRLEDYLREDLSIVAPDLMLIGRQIATDYGKFIDLLAMDADGNLTVIELKRDRTPREVVAQVLDYASWLRAQTGSRSFPDHSPFGKLHFSKVCRCITDDLLVERQRLNGFLGRFRSHSRKIGSLSTTLST